MCRSQHTSESISNYITVLKELAKTSDSKSETQQSVLNLLLCAQFIRALYDAESEKILQQSELSFDQALEIVLAIEASKVEYKELYKTSATNVFKLPISHKKQFSVQIKSIQFQ